MEQDTQLEENLKMENATTLIKREYKHALENLAHVKEDTNAILSIKDKVIKEVAEKKIELQETLNQIAKEKTDWLIKRHQEQTELEAKQSEAQNVLNRKKELNEQEETIRQETKKNESVLNENRQLEFKMGQEKTALEVEANRNKSRELDMTRREEKLLKDKKEFQEKVVLVLKEAENL